jgi:death-on-curing protein
VAHYLTLADVVALHAEVMERLGQGANPLRDEGALASAISRPRMAAHYEDADVVRQAALLAVGISQAQAFLDGNKRTAFAVLFLFLSGNGSGFVGDSVQLGRQLEIVAERGGDRAAAEDAFEAWLRARVQPTSG